jgi:glutamate N-acetyltransferase / amino-acid N-acetyltransferase
MPTAPGRGVTAPLGFTAAGVRCGIKAAALDLAAVAAARLVSAAALFTTNLVKAAPVLVSTEHLGRSGGRARAIVINSGCANACTGTEGLQVARAMAGRAAAALGVPDEQILIASTGVIGVALDAGKVAAGIADAVANLDRAAHLDAARAIMTTDRGPKEAAVTGCVAGREFRVGGMAKGAGMIEPCMATMLAVITTDAAVPPPLLDRALRTACAGTFNAITIDGDTSTNDTVFALASGESAVEIGPAELPAFEEALTAVCLELAIAIVRGGEGATRVVTVRVHGAGDDADARRIARTIANSLLVKTAVHGGDPNWGRILAAAGRAGIPFDPEKATVGIGPVILFDAGQPRDDRAAEAAQFLRRDDVTIDVKVGPGSGAAVVYTCDLSAEYVRINGEYRT